MIVTIDGPSGTGKSTVARSVAKRLGFTFFDTGAMYRSVTWAILEKGISLDDPKQIEALLSDFDYEIHPHDNEVRHFVNGVDVTEAIRMQRITDFVSEVSALPSVREAMWKRQQEYGEMASAVFEGRDMGSVVFPKARVKVFLDASPEVRAERRLKEMRSKLPKDAAAFDLAAMEKELKRRDAYDSSRKLAPLRKPKGALIIDTSVLSIDEVVEQIVVHARETSKKLIPAWLHSKKMKFLYRWVIFKAWYLFRILYRHKVYGLEHYVKRAAIIAPNHTSYYDPPIAAISWPEEVHFLARESLFRNPLFGRFIRALNSHPVSGDVSDVSIFKMIISLLKEGKQVVLFPEGARTEGELGEIKPGIGMLVMRSKSAIVPTYIHGANEIWDIHRKVPKLRGRTACVFGTPILWEAFAHLEKREAQEKISEQLREALLALKAWYESGAKGTPP